MGYVTRVNRMRWVSLRSWYLDKDSKEKEKGAMCYGEILHEVSTHLRYLFKDSRATNSLGS